ncbi:BMP family lipoprotein [Lacticigenium naphthae]|uniref:BMP family lipoprotein n=1 Tax=Lacticigenium naphthae TaxID=515351 RepID=UPI000411EB43|nr:BMP family protein [Lacticigenium naphthae]
MKKRNLRSLIALGFASTFVLAACGGEDAEETVDTTDTSETTEDTTEESSANGEFSVVMVTDIGGVDDKSFNQSAWEGMEAWGEEHGLEEGSDGYTYIQSDDDSQFVTNLNTALQSDFDLIYGIGYKLQPAMADVATQNPDQHFVIIDEVIEEDNVASVLFKDHEAAFLAGVAAAETTQTDYVGFVGGQESAVIDRFEAGFVAGVEAVNEDITVDVQYAGSFGDAATGKQIAAGMFSNGADIIYHASGDTGNGVFSEAIDRMNAGSDNDLWVIGVDRDQSEEGNYSDGNLTLTSTIKGVGQAVQDLANQSMEGNFPGGEISNFGLADDGVDLVQGNLSDEAWASVEEYRQQIIDGEIEVPEAPQ